ncbi:adenylate kinase [Erysipelothrix larvae]|uniref:Adenylate kinase n=1 Tax=Erysipelothrix larvae TaxID=1514105 RepID=A0A120JTQ3_9FIRM|nr:adenylate kinase [Erysipelothrix larvae]AMC93570.1 adenylate kinase [Erysipelothrix larvae]
MNYLIMGPAGSGKGTMSKEIVNKLNIAYISTGDMFREALSKQTPVGMEAKEYMDQGKLVPDDVTNRMVKERISQGDCLNGYLLDGFPRSIAQVEAFDVMSKEINRPIDLVLNLDVNHDELVKRITGRRLCPTCGAIYHIDTRKPKVEGICDLDQTPLIQRDDDTEEKFEVRHQAYLETTLPVIEFYRSKGLVRDINADQPIELVLEDIFKVLEASK